MKASLKEWIAKVSAAFAKTIDWDSVTDVAWGTSTWEAPENGFMEILVTPSTNNWYFYITDTWVGGTWSHTMSGTNTNRISITFPVHKGAVLSTAQRSNVSSFIARYYKLKSVGGVVRRLFSLLTLERRWAV